MSLTSYFWTTNKEGFFNEIKTNFLILLFPLILFIDINIKSKTLYILKILFILSSFLLSIKILVYCSYGYTMLEHYNGNLYLYNQNLIERILSTITLGYEKIYNAAQYTYPNKNGVLHRNYSSTIYLFSIVFLISLIEKVNSLQKKIMLALLILYFSITITYYHSLVNILILILISVYFILKKTNIPPFKTIAILFMVLFSFSLYNYSSILDLFKKFDIERYILYKTAFGIIKENIYFGIGMGDVYETINKMSKDMRALYNISELNNHSQFLFYFLSGGIASFVLFIAHFFRLINFNRSNFEVIFLTLIFLSNCLFENFLSRMVGVELYLILFFVISLNNKSINNV
jgi:hypothetical protein